MAHYTNVLSSQIVLQYVGDGSKFYPYAPLQNTPFVFNGTALQLETLLNEGQYVLVRTPVIIQVVTTDLAPGTATDPELDALVNLLITNPSWPTLSPVNNIGTTTSDFYYATARLQVDQSLYQYIHPNYVF